MALGKNIKKDTLIPDGKKVKASREVTKRKTTVKKTEDNKVEEVAEQIEERVVQSLEVSNEEEKKEQGQLSIKRTLSGKEYITEKEYQERKRLQNKFESEISKLKGKELQLVSFPLGKENFSIDIHAIKEVVPLPKVARIPHAPKFIRGVANIRGVVMVIIDLEFKFKYKTEDDTDDKAEGFCIVIRGAGFNAAIKSPKVPTTLKTSGKNIVSSSGLLSHTALDESYIKGLVKTEDGMVIYLDIKELIKDQDVKVLSETIAQLK